jgi:hypothetical protein
MEEEWMEPEETTATEDPEVETVDAVVMPRSKTREMVPVEKRGEFDAWLDRVKQPGMDADFGALVTKDPEEVERVMNNRQLALRTMERNAMEATRPQDWILRRGKDGSVSAGMNSAGAQRICDALSISVFPTCEPQLRVEGEDGSRTAWQTGVAYRATTNRLAINLLAERNSKEPFIGRGDRAPGQPVSDGDLKSSAAQLLYRKAAEALTGIRNLRPEDLKRFNINPDECTKGFGFSEGDRDGTSGTRAGTGQATAKQREALWNMAGKAGVKRTKIKRGKDEVGVVELDEDVMKKAGVKAPVVVRDLSKRSASEIIGWLKDKLDAEAAESGVAD